MMNKLHSHLVCPHCTKVLEISMELNAVVSSPLLAQNRKPPKRAAPKRAAKLKAPFENVSLDPNTSCGGSLSGYLTATYAQLETLLGKPATEVDSYKVSTEWTLKIGAAYVRIYDWKSTSLYDESYPSPEKFRDSVESYDWHVGCEGASDIAALISILPAAIAVTVRDC